MPGSAYYLKMQQNKAGILNDREQYNDGWYSGVHIDTGEVDAEPLFHGRTIVQVTLQRAALAGGQIAQNLLRLAAGLLRLGCGANADTGSFAARILALRNLLDRLDDLLPPLLRGPLERVLAPGYRYGQ